METETLVQELAPVRLPAEVARFGLDDALAMAALGLVAGVILSRLLRLVTVRREGPRDLVRREVVRLSFLNRERRLTGLASLFDRIDPAREAPRPSGLARALYDPAAHLDPAEIERALTAAARRRWP